MHFSTDKLLVLLFHLEGMEEYVVNNAEHLNDEQISKVDNRTMEKATQNQSSVQETGRAIVARKFKPMQPTPLYVLPTFCFINCIMNMNVFRGYSWWSTHHRERDRGAIALFLVTAMFVGILVVFLTSKTQSMSALEISETVDIILEEKTR